MPRYSAISARSGTQQRFDQVGGEKAVLADRAGGQRQLGDFAGDQVQVRRLLCALAETWKKPVSSISGSRHGPRAR
jgi:hypothetical protein